MAGLAFDREHLLSNILSELRCPIFSFSAIAKSRILPACRSSRWLESLASQAFQASRRKKFIFLFFIACIPALC